LICPHEVFSAGVKSQGGIPGPEMARTYGEGQGTPMRSSGLANRTKVSGPLKTSGADCWHEGEVVVLRITVGH
jgi:hypothetical protein